MNIILFGVGLACYLVFFYTILAFIAFFGNLSLYFPLLKAVFPFNIDAPDGAMIIYALAVNSFWIFLFGLQHSTMARQWFKTRLTHVMPASVERSFFVLLSSLVLLGMMAFWQPMHYSVWNVSSLVGQTILWILFASGWALLFFSSFIINHFELFGLRQTYLAYIRKEYTHLPFQIKSLYKMIRHPLYLGFIIGMFATPHMSAGHLFLASGLTIYIFIGIYFEERDMAKTFGDPYQKYCAETPKIIPFWIRKR